MASPGTIASYRTQGSVENRGGGALLGVLQQDLRIGCEILELKYIP
jgi:hypothetical protein